MVNRYHLFAHCLAYLAVPIAIGFTTGWLVGISQTPVVATAIPLIFGLLSAVGFGIINAILQKSAILNAISVADLASDIKQSLEAKIREGASPTSAVFASIGAVLFCVAFYLGVPLGVGQRVPKYPAIAETFHGIKLSPEVVATLFRLRLTLAVANFSRDEYIEAMETIVEPILIDSQNGSFENQQSVRLSQLNQVIDILSKSGAAKPHEPAGMAPLAPAPELPPPPAPRA